MKVPTYDGDDTPGTYTVIAQGVTVTVVPVGHWGQFKISRAVSAADSIISRCICTRGNQIAWKIYQVFRRNYENFRMNIVTDLLPIENKRMVDLNLVFVWVQTDQIQLS